MQIFHTQHNANLLNTLPLSEPIVKYVIRDNEDKDRVEYKVDYAPSKQFVKIMNSIYDLQLKPRILEFYCFMSYLTYSHPEVELPILKIQELILVYTGINFSKNTINKYINELIELGLIKRVGKYYCVYGDRSSDKANLLTTNDSMVTSNSNRDSMVSCGLVTNDSEVTSNSTNSRQLALPPSCQRGITGGRSEATEHQSSLKKGQRGITGGRSEATGVKSSLKKEVAVSETDGGCSYASTSKKKVLTHTTKTKGNIYFEPKTNYKPFFITIYNTDTKSGSMALELYLASKPYNHHRPTKVCKDLNISRATYYKYLKDLVIKGIIKKHIVTNSINHYTNDYRQTLWNDFISISDIKYMDNKFKWQDINKAKKLKKEQNNYKTPHSRLWYVSSMARVMKQYRINYIKAFDSYDPEDAYCIVQELETQYKNNPANLKAGLIVIAILESYNWTKIIDRRHTKLKHDQQREKAKLGNSRYMEELFVI